jgi:hypothetical protein
MHGLSSSTNEAPQCALRMMCKPLFSARRPPCSKMDPSHSLQWILFQGRCHFSGLLPCRCKTGTATIFVMGLDRSPVPSRKLEREGESVAQRIRENTLCPSENGSSPVFRDGPQAICTRPHKMGCIMAHRPSLQQAVPSDDPIC